jgi:hypothetical protein
MRHSSKGDRIVDFRCIALPTETAERFRATGIDDRGASAIARELRPGPVAHAATASVSRALARRCC